MYAFMDFFMDFLYAFMDFFPFINIVEHARLSESWVEITRTASGAQ